MWVTQAPLEYTVPVISKPLTRASVFSLSVPTLLLSQELSSVSFPLPCSEELGGGAPLMLQTADITMVFLIQQILCGWQEHLHELRHLPDDMNGTQRCLQKNEGGRHSNGSEHSPPPSYNARTSMSYLRLPSFGELSPQAGKGPLAGRELSGPFQRHDQD